MGHGHVRFGHFNHRASSPHPAQRPYIQVTEPSLIEFAEIKSGGFPLTT
jgi:hypothetical protein